MNVGRSLALTGGVVLVAVLAAAFLYGRDARARIDQAEATASAQENGVFCGDLGLAPDGEAHARCINGLRDIRQRHRTRWEADAAGIL
jgi:hypothetical protein